MNVKKHPAEDFLIATRGERAGRMADMPPMISVVPGGLRGFSWARWLEQQLERLREE